MPLKKIQRITRAFGDAAVLARQAGFDMIQVHGDRMCGSFSSAVYSHRTDDYGGSAENRARFALKAVRSCLRCNRACLGGLMVHKGVHCVFEKENAK